MTALDPPVRETWIDDERRVLDRAFRLLASRQISIALHCEVPACHHPLVRHDGIGGQFMLACPHKTRIFTPGL